MAAVWEFTLSVAIHHRRTELETEQKALEEKGKYSSRKAEKINGLLRLESEIQIRDPALFGVALSKTTEQYPELTSGVFSKRTAMLISEITALAPVFH